MTVLVTGARGFVGRRLVARLLQGGWSVVGIDREVDVADEAQVAKTFAEARPDAVVHLAALSFVPTSWKDPKGVYRVNFLGVRSVLEAARLHAPRARVLVVSSGHVYGTAAPRTEPFTEASPLRPSSPYAWSKAAADRLGALYAERGLDVLRARPFNHTGPGRPDHFVESSFARQIAEVEAGKRPPRIEVGNLDALRDFLDVDDVIEAYLKLLDPAVPRGVYNVASGVARPIRAVLDTLLARAAVDPEVATEPSRWRATDSCVGSADKLRAVTGWHPRIRLDDTLERLLEVWRETVRDA